METMNDQSESSPENICRGILDALQEELSWKWDSRFETVLAEFNVDRKDLVHETLKGYFSIIWDMLNIDRAPEAVRIINNHLGGLRPGQLLFTSDSNRDAFLFCAWWPWGNGTTISIRLAAFLKGGGETVKAEQITQFRGWFGV
jgi:hypothetical protein